LPTTPLFATATRSRAACGEHLLFGQVKNPGAYPLRQRATTVLQALSLAGGVSDRGSTTRIRVVRIVDGQKKEIKVTLSDVIRPGDTIIVSERFL
jgi:polysaccharide export outer membrane protein